MSKKTPALPAKCDGEPGEVGDPSVRDDQLRVRVRVDETVQAVGDRRQAAPAVDEDRHAPLRGDREHGREPVVVEQELLRPRVQLDAARAEVEAPLRLSDRILGEVEADEGDHPAVRPLGERERPVVAGAESGVPVGLVQAEEEAPRDPVPVERLLELLEPADAAVDVGAEVCVRVEDVHTGRHFGPQLDLECGEELAGALQRLHPPTVSGLHMSRIRP